MKGVVYWLFEPVDNVNIIVYLRKLAVIVMHGST